MDSVNLKLTSSKVDLINCPQNKNIYAMPEPIPSGEVLTDLLNTKWKIGIKIGNGAFGAIYSACLESQPHEFIHDYEYVVKIEPHSNEALLVESEFYLKNSKLRDIKNFQENTGLENIGIPCLLGNGSHEINNIKHRFIVIPRFSTTIWNKFIENNRQIPEHTIYRLALQMLNAYEYIHSCDYIHGDFKGANILVGLNDKHQAYLVDYGLASHITKDFKPNSRNMHNGTLEYISRDAHRGISTIRGDMETLGYNIILWSGMSLPWINENILKQHIKVQECKQAFMSDIENSLEKIYGNKVPEPIIFYMKYVSELDINEKPNYDICRKYFENGLEILGKLNSGNLEFSLKQTISNSSLTTLHGSTSTSSTAINGKLSSIDTISENENSFDENKAKRYLPIRSKSIKRKIIGNTRTSSEHETLKMKAKTTASEKFVHKVGIRTRSEIKRHAEGQLRSNIEVVLDKVSD